MEIQMMATKGYDQLTENGTYFADSLISGVKTAEEVMAERVDYCGPVKTIHNGFLSRYIRKVDVTAPT